MISLILSFLLTLKFQKYTIFIFGCCLEVLVLFSFYFLEADSSSVYIYLTLAFRGLTLGPTYLIPASLLPDVISYYYNFFSIKREATFYSITNFFEKLILAFSFLISSWLLGYFDYTNPYTQVEQSTNESDSTALILQCLVSIFPAFFSILAIFLGILYYFIVARNSSYSDNQLVLSDDNE